MRSILVVQTIVRGCQAPSPQNVQRLTDELVPENDRDAFKKMTLDFLQRLHEGNVARYRLKLSDFLAWKPIRDQHDSPDHQ